MTDEVKTRELIILTRKILDMLEGYGAFVSEGVYEGLDCVVLKIPFVERCNVNELYSELVRASEND